MTSTNNERHRAVVGQDRSLKLSVNDHDLANKVRKDS